MDRNTLLVVIEYVIRILVVIIGTYLINLIRSYKLEKWVQIAVNAAEQIFNEKGLGEKKKEYVVNFIKDKFKFNLSISELDVLIEAAVKELNRLEGTELGQLILSTYDVKPEGSE